MTLTCCYLGLVGTEKQKLMAVTTIDGVTPPLFPGFENSSLQLPFAQLQPWSSSSSAHAIATGALELWPLRSRVHGAVPAALAMRPRSLPLGPTVGGL